MPVLLFFSPKSLKQSQKLEMDKKQIEKRHYDKKAGNISFDEINHRTVSTNDLVLLKAHIFFEQCLEKMLTKKGSGILLDYGCGIGNKTNKFVNKSWKLIGIDISEKSIELAQKMYGKKGNDASYYVMDCEKMSFPDNYFDVIVDYGTFSSLNMNKALPELVRVLKPNGTIICIETFGHNPLTNLKRKFNVFFGKRTKWAASHIMKTKDWTKIFLDFKQYKIYYFGFTTLLLSPFIKLFVNNFAKILLTSAEKVDGFLFRFNTFRRWAFKTVVILNDPKNK